MANWAIVSNGTLRRHLVALCVLLSPIVGCAAPVSTVGGSAVCAHPAETTRHELFFGLLGPDSGVITEGEFTSFVNEVVRPHFPEGLTLIDATGQYQLSNGATIKEPTKVLILVYPDTQDVREKISDVITQYRTRFRQESVGWVRTAARACF